MRLVAIATLLFCALPVMAAEESAEYFKQVENRQTYCKNTPACMDEEGLSVFGEKAERRSVLVLKTEKGEVVLSDKGTAPAERVRYYFVDYLAPYHHYAVALETGTEGGHGLLVDEKTGAVLELLGGAPGPENFSPDGKHMVDYQYSVAGYTENGLRLYRFDAKNGFVKEKESFAPCFAGVVKEGEAVESLEHRWQGSRALELKLHLLAGTATRTEICVLKLD